MMHEIARVTLENEMDLILAHKRSMKLAEVAGLSVAAQTTFATAVSEVSRNSIDAGKGGCLVLNVEFDRKLSFIVAKLLHNNANIPQSQEGLQYAKRLVHKYRVVTDEKETSIELYFHCGSSSKNGPDKIDEWRVLFRNELPVSAYDVLKRKNEELRELSDRIQKSEAQYKSLTNSLPLIIFSLDATGQLVYANEWLIHLTGESLKNLNDTLWKNVVHEDDFEAFSQLMAIDISRNTVDRKIQARLKHKSGTNFIWHQVSLSPVMSEAVGLRYWIGYIVDIHAQKILEETLRDNFELKQAQDQLEKNQKLLESSIADLNRSNEELQHFAFIASHDLQEPVRKLLFYSDYLISKYTGHIDQKAIEYLSHMQSASQRMRTLIQDILVFSRIEKGKLNFVKINLNELATESIQDLEIALEEKQALVNVANLPHIYGDARMIRQLFENLISNAVKYSKQGQRPSIEIRGREKNGFCELEFEDNGIGFDEKYLPRMFMLFQRLHGKEQYEGTGLGLAICSKIVELHHGKIWAKGSEGEGATFYISLPVNVTNNQI